MENKKINRIGQKETAGAMVEMDEAVQERKKKNKVPLMWQKDLC